MERQSSVRRNFPHQLFVATALFLLFPLESTGLKWLWLHNHFSYGGSGGGEEISCDHFSLISKQVKFCKNNPVFMDSIRIAAGKSIQECQYQFRHNRWNCSIDVAATNGGAPSAPGAAAPFGAAPVPVPARQIAQQHIGSPKALEMASHNSKRNQRNLQQQSHQHGGHVQLHHHVKSSVDDKQSHHKKQQQHHKDQNQLKFPFVAQGTKEAAFIHSLSSAGVAHQLTKSCSAGASPDCGCDKSLSDSKGGSFKWAGCSDNIDYGVSLSRTFVDAMDHRMSRKNKTASLALVNLHNNEAGRKSLQKLMRVECKCHGVSGSCEIKTCWRVMPNMRDIGEHLRRKFELAKSVEEKRLGSRRGLVARSSGQEFNDVDLVFLKESPDFCTSNLKKGSLGTKGRICKQITYPDKVTIPDTCDKLCCGRGHTTTRVKRIEMCRCKFQWCCNVTCSECVKQVEVSTCN